MITVDQPMLFDANRFGIIAEAGGTFVPRQKIAGFVPHQMTRVVEHVSEPACIKEWKTPDGEVIARKVEACGGVECWLRADLALQVLVDRAEEAAERERVLREMAAYINASRQHSRDQMAETYVLSSALIHAAVRRNAKLGRLYDMNSRGDKTRGNLAAALDRAAKAEAEGAK